MSDFQSVEKDIQTLLDTLKYNKKAFTPKTLSTQSGVTLNVVTAFLSALNGIPYLTLTKSPSGRLIRYALNPYSKHIYYANCYCIIEKGHTTVGDNRSHRMVSSDGYYKSTLSTIPDKARNDGLPFMNGCLNRNLFVADLLTKMGITPLPEKTADEVAMDALSDFLLVKAAVAALHTKKKQLEDELATEIQSNADKKQWFEVETRKARMGQRTKPEDSYVPTISS